MILSYMESIDIAKKIYNREQQKHLQVLKDDLMYKISEYISSHGILEDESKKPTRYDDGLMLGTLDDHIKHDQLMTILNECAITFKCNIEVDLKICYDSLGMESTGYQIYYLIFMKSNDDVYNAKFCGHFRGRTTRREDNYVMRKHGRRGRS